MYIFSEHQVHFLGLKQLLLLEDQVELRLLEDADQFLLAYRTQGYSDRQSPQ